MASLCSRLTLVFATLSLPSCFLFTSSLTPEQKACLNQAMQDVPDLTGSWVTSHGVTLDLTKASGVGFHVQQRPTDNKKIDWVIEGAGLEAPLSVHPQSPECATQWTVKVRQKFPNRKPDGPGQMVRLTEYRTATLSGDRDRIDFGGGEHWKRVGAAGPLLRPKPGVAAEGMEISGPTLSTLQTQSTHTCFDACQRDTRCAAAFHFVETCTLKSAVGDVSRRTHATTWISPAFDPRPPPPVPLPGQVATGLKLEGEPFKTIGLGGRSQRRSCAAKCDEDWTCRAYSYHSYDGTCELLRRATSTRRDKEWVSSVMLAPTARMPDRNSFEEDTFLTGRALATKNFGKLAKVSACLDACRADKSCKAVSYGPDAECELKGAALGAAQPRKGWTSWLAPLPPPDLSKPPDQTMTSPLCQGHGHAFPARILTTDPIGRDASARLRYVDIPGLVQRGAPKQAIYVQADAGGVSWTKAFYPRPLPDGTVHFHTFYDPDLVLKRDQGAIVVGAADSHSAWRIEHLFEHRDPLPDGVWYVVRDPETKTFLAARGGGLELVGSPDDTATHWRLDELRLPAEYGKPSVDLVVQEPPRLILDQGALNKLTDWAVREYYRQQQPSCWKKGGRGDCPSGQSTNCGLFCAQSSEMCVLEVTEMVVSVSELAANIAGAVLTAGTANVALKAARGARTAAKLGMRQVMRSAGRKLADKLKNRLGARIFAFIKTRGKSESFKRLAREVAKDMALKAGEITAKQALGNEADAYLDRQQARFADKLADAYAQEVSRMAAEKIALQAVAGNDTDWLEIAATLDPTGVMAVVDAMYKPECEEIPPPDISL